MHEIPGWAVDDRWPLSLGDFPAVVPADTGDVLVLQLVADARLRPCLSLGSQDSPSVEIHRYRVRRFALGKPLEYLPDNIRFYYDDLHSVRGVSVGARTVGQAAFRAFLLLVFHAA